MTRIVIFGATGKLGGRLVNEALSRGHAVMAVIRGNEDRSDVPSGTTVTVGDSTAPDSVRTVAAGVDVLISAVGGPDKTIYLRTAQAFVSAVASEGTAGPRIIHSGGGGSLLNSNGVRFVDAPDFPAQLKDEVLGQAAALDYYRASSGTIWTYMSPPPGNFAPGERRGRYRIGTESPVVSNDGTFGISYEDYALALIDEVETGAHFNMRFTVGY